MTMNFLPARTLCPYHFHSMHRSSHTVAVQFTARTGCRLALLAKWKDTGLCHRQVPGLEPLQNVLGFTSRTLLNREIRYSRLKYENNISCSQAFPDAVYLWRKNDRRIMSMEASRTSAAKYYQYQLAMCVQWFFFQGPWLLQTGYCRWE